MATNVSRGTTQNVATVGTPTLWIIGGLGIAMVGGLIGSFFESGDDMQAILYSLASIGGMVAGLLLLVRHARARLDLSAAGFGALAVLGVAGSVTGYTGSSAEFVAAYLAVLHWPATWLIAAQNWAPVWARAAAGVSGLMFALWGYSVVLGDTDPSSDSPIVIIAWITFIAASVGWILTLREEGDPGTGGTTGTQPL